MSYVVKKKVSINGRQYNEGEKLENLTHITAEQLIDMGIIEKEKEKEKQK